MNNEDKREQFAKQLIARGYASVDELLTVSFGEWPAKGLDIVHKNPRRVILTNSPTDFYQQSSCREMVTWKEMASRMQEAFAMSNYTGKQRIIYVNEQRLSKSAYYNRVKALAPETAGILHGDYSVRCDEIMGKDGGMARIGWVCYDAVTKATYGRFKKENFIKNLFNAISDAIFNKIDPYEGYDEGYSLGSYMSALGVQERLHEALVAGYPSWGCLPQNKDEFFFAMKSVGFTLTRAIERMIENHPAKAELERIFPRLKDQDSPKDRFIRGIEFFVSGLTDKGKRYFWYDAMPQIYGNLIEMYGDRLGRQRMGYGVNETHRFRQQHARDIATIAGARWQPNRRSHKRGLYFRVKLDSLSKRQTVTLMKALDNQYIKASVKQNSSSLGHRWLVVSGDQSMKKLQACISQERSRQRCLSPLPIPK